MNWKHFGIIIIMLIIFIVVNWNKIKERLS